MRRPKLKVEFCRTEAHKRALPTRKEMTTWIRSAQRIDMELIVSFVDETQSKLLNAHYRRRNRPTNVLTFDYSHEPVAKADVVICTRVIEAEAEEQKKSFRAHLAHMLVHASLHAQGWDHATDEQAEAMEALETQILKGLHFPDPYSDRARAH